MPYMEYVLYIPIVYWSAGDIKGSSGEWGGKLQVQHREAKPEQVMQIAVDHPRAPLGDWETIISERRE